MKHRCLLLLLTAGLLSVCPAAQAQLNVLHSFNMNNANDGALPHASLTVSNSTLYGTTFFGGPGVYGTVFSMNTNGSGFTVLHEFIPISGGARELVCSLALSGSTLFGMTGRGGSADKGTVFSVNTNGSGFTTLHTFTGMQIEGENPHGSLTISGSTLYGMTTFGGNPGVGTIFSMNTVGTGFTVLHHFGADANDGRNPEGSLTLAGGKLYGTTQAGGSNSVYGTVFNMNTDGTGYSVLHSFNEGNGEGFNPYGAVTIVGQRVYGMTSSGGTSGNGAIFGMDADGSNYSVLHSFNAASGDGSGPRGSLTLAGTKLVGMTEQGGNSTRGMLFSINLDGSGYSKLLDLVGGASSGSNPLGDLSLSANGQTLYGMTYSGGASDNGIVFSTPVPEPATCALLVFGGISILAARRQRAAARANLKA